MRTSPLVGGKMPARMRMVVVLPAPFGPRKPTISPASTRNEMSRTASTAPKVLVRSRTSIIAWPMLLPGISNRREQLRGELVQVRETAGGAGEVVVEGQVARQGDGARPGGERGAQPALGVLHHGALPRREPEGSRRGEVGVGRRLGAGVVLARDGGVEERRHAQVREEEGHLGARAVGREPQPVRRAEAAKRVERTRAGRDARAQEGRVDERLLSSELVWDDPQRVGTARVTGAE